jgi:hypothetical protein
MAKLTKKLQDSAFIVGAAIATGVLGAVLTVYAVKKVVSLL